MRISDWSSDVCSSDLAVRAAHAGDSSVHPAPLSRRDSGFGRSRRDATEMPAQIAMPVMEQQANEWPNQPLRQESRLNFQFINKSRPVRHQFAEAIVPSAPLQPRAGVFLNAVIPELFEPQCTHLKWKNTDKA